MLTNLLRLLVLSGGPHSHQTTRNALNDLAFIGNLRPGKMELFNGRERRFDRKAEAAMKGMIKETTFSLFSAHAERLRKIGSDLLHHASSVGNKITRPLQKTRSGFERWHSLLRREQKAQANTILPNGLNSLIH